MKKFLLQSILFVSAAVVGLLTGCTEPESQETISVSDSQVTLLGDGSETQAITILSAPGEVAAEAGASWLRVSDIVDNVLSISADPNDSGSERSSFIELTSGKAVVSIKVRQLAAEGSGVHFRYLNDYRFSAMSPNGRWIGAVREEFTDDGEQGFIPAFIDTETNELFELPIIRTSACNIQGINCVSNDGKMFVFNANATSSGIIDLEGNLTFPQGLEDTEDINWNDRVPDINATSEDGSIWVGYQFRNVLGYTYHPVIVENGVPRLLPMPETDYAGHPWSENINGIIVHGCSADASIIYGMDMGYANGAVYWTKADNYAEAHWVKKADDIQDDGEDVNIVNGVLGNGFTTAISPNGEWLAVDGGFVRFVDGYTDGIVYPASGLSMGATNDGIGFTQSGVVDIVNNASLGSTAEWVSAQYDGISYSGGWIEFQSADGRCLKGTREETGNSSTVHYGWYIFRDVQ